MDEPTSLTEALADLDGFVESMAVELTVTITRPGDGALIQYRRDTTGRPYLALEGRVLRADGTPHPGDGGRYYPTSDAEWVWLRRFFPQVLTTLLPELAGSSTLTPRG